MLIRNARLVRVGAARGDSDDPVDLLIEDGAVSAVATGLPAGSLPVVQADGRWLAPGLWDHHVHMLQWARTLTWVDTSGATSPAEVTARVAAALTSSDAPVLTGFGHRSAVWPTQPTVAELDAVSGSRPVVLISGDGHNGWLNSAALAMLGVPPRDGALDENDWFPVFARLDSLAHDARADEAAYREAARRASAVGIVGITDMEFGRGFHDWPGRYATGLDSLRVRTASYPDTLDEVIALGYRTGDPLRDGGGMLTMGPLKIISDGSLNTRTAYCAHPYVDDPTSRGKLNVSTAELTELLDRAHRHGLQVAVHAIGDAAVGSALAACAASGARGTIEHAQLMATEDIAKMGSLGLTASVQPAHLIDDRDVTAVCWPDRADRCFPLRSLLDAGVPLALGSDAPVAPLDPWLAMAAAVHRSGDEREPWNAAESLDAAAALAASTSGAQTLTAGSPADLVLLDSDPLAPAADSAGAARILRTMHVALTVVNGRVTHQAL